MCIKTNVTDRKLVSSLHSAAALRQISKESFRTERWPINVPSMKHIYSENTLYDGGCKKTGETFMKAESPVAAELLLVRPKCAKRLRKFQIVDVRPIRARRKLNF